MGSFVGLLDIKYLHEAMSAIAYPLHQPMVTFEANEKESLQLALDMEICGKLLE